MDVPRQRRSRAIGRRVVERVWVAIAVVAWSCETHRTALAPRTGGPLFHFFEFQCAPLKITGGGRIDYPLK